MLLQYERDIVKCVSSILEGKGDNTGMPSYATTEAWWGLPDSQLAEFLQIQQARLMEARLQKEAIWKKLPAKAKREADKLQQDVEDACQQISVRLRALHVCYFGHVEKGKDVCRVVVC